MLADAMTGLLPRIYGVVSRRGNCVGNGELAVYAIIKWRLQSLLFLNCEVGIIRWMSKL